MLCIIIALNKFKLVSQVSDVAHGPLVCCYRHLELALVFVNKAL